MPLLEIEALHVHIDTPVHRGVGAGEDARHGERVVLEAVVGPVGGGEPVPDPEPEFRRHRAAEHTAEELLIAEVPATGEAERPAVSQGEPIEVGGICPDDAEALVIVSHADRHGRGNAPGKPAGCAVGPSVGRQKLLVEVPGDVFDWLADKVDAVEHQLQRAPFRSDDQVVPEPRARAEGVADQAPDDERGHHERHAEREREGRQPTGEEPLADAPPGDAEECHDRPARLKSSSRRRRGNWRATSGS